MMTSEHSQEAPGHNKTIVVTINTRDVEVNEKHLSYEGVAKLAYPNDAQDGSIIYTVSYSSEHGHDGKLVAGDKVNVKEGMVFVVVKSGRS
jgi:hypothetical protein